MQSRTYAIIVAVLAGTCSLPAYAYLDPGTGSALIQGLIAAIAAIGVTLKLYWHRLVSFFGRNVESVEQEIGVNAQEEKP